MAYSPIAFTAANYRDYKFNWLKAYEPGTTTPKAMGTDSTLSAFISKAQVNVDGFFVSAGGTLITPYVDGTYDLWLFPTEAEAEANDTSSALRLADAVTGAADLAEAISLAPVSEVVTLIDGQTVVTFPTQTTGGAEFHINGIGVDSRMLTSLDYNEGLTTASTITLFDSYPAGSVVTLSKNTSSGASSVARDFVHNEATLDAATLATNLVVGDSINLAERTTGNGGGAMWDVVLSTSVTENGDNIVQCTGVPTLSLVRRDDWGSVGNLSQSYIFDTVAAFKASLIEFPDGKVIHLTDRGADFTKLTGTGTANGFDIIASTGVNQSVTLTIEQGASLRSLGCLGDGVDDTPALINAMSLGIKIIGTNGDYRYTGSIAVASNTKLIGDSLSCKFIQGTDDIKCFDLGDSTNVIVSAVSFQGRPAATALGSTVNTAITSTDTTTKVKNCYITGCSFKDFASWPIDFKGPQTGVYSHNVYVLNNTLDGMTDEGINYYYIRDGLISGNIITDHKREAIKAGTCDRIIISNNNIRCNGTSTIDFQGPLINLGTNANFCVVSDNYTFQGTIGIGLEKGVSYTSITGNVCESPSEQGIGVANTNVGEPACHAITITGNTCKGGTPINLDSTAGLRPYDLTVTGNTLETTDNFPCISAEFLENCVISGNTLRGGGSGKDSIAIANVNHVTINGNTMYEPDNWGIDINNCVTATVLGNTVINPNQNASIAYGGINIDTTVTTAIIKGNNVYGATDSYFIGVSNKATNAIFDQNMSTGHTNAAQRGTGSGKNGEWTTVQLGVVNNLSATTPGSVVNKFEVFDKTGASLGFVPVYSAIT